MFRNVPCSGFYRRPIWYDSTLILDDSAQLSTKGTCCKQAEDYSFHLQTASFSGNCSRELQENRLVEFTPNVSRFQLLRLKLACFNVHKNTCCPF